MCMFGKYSKSPDGSPLVVIPPVRNAEIRLGRVVLEPKNISAR
ncbi:MAG: hypothetical protein QXS27_00095 [Candidatus Jordarchaeaceae archaeon]